MKTTMLWHPGIADGPRIVDSDAPAILPVTVAGWYQCTDGTHAFFRGATVLADRPEHTDRAPTVEERARAIELDAEASQRAKNRAHDP